MADSGGRDFFISYTGVNRPWAEWIAVQLQAAGYRPSCTPRTSGLAATSSSRSSRPRLAEPEAIVRFMDDGD